MKNISNGGLTCLLSGSVQEAPKFQSVFSGQNCQNVRFFQTKDGIRFPAHKYSIETFLIKPGSRCTNVASFGKVAHLIVKSVS